VGENVVTRRVDNNYVNGTKLLNVAGLRRGQRYVAVERIAARYLIWLTLISGRRDNLLKKEIERHVIKFGKKLFKGIW
jgi:hypothetical protein